MPQADTNADMLYMHSFLSAINDYRDSGFLSDCRLRINVNDHHHHHSSSSFQCEEFLTHRLVLAAGSPYFKELLVKESTDTPSTITIHLHSIDAINCFKVVLDYLYTGKVHMNNCEPINVLHVVKLCRIKELENKLQTELVVQMKEEHDDTWMDNKESAQPIGAYFTQPSLYRPFSPAPLLSENASKVDQLSAAKHATDNDVDDSKPMAVPVSVASAPFDNLGDVIVPSSDKEGWCRNKKYIERVQNGFMCVVCRKVYGRYNSVSYHVTIYHRNPPIKCDEHGCQFTTREARYIHFHKYYRHHIALPESIDLGSRKCPFCRHVSKSPAMLEKHINRHMPESSSSTTSASFKCPQCGAVMDTQRAMYDHLLTHTIVVDDDNNNNYQCDQCNYKGRTAANLKQHNMFKHSLDTFKKKHQCDLCNYTCATKDNIIAHYARAHHDRQRAADLIATTNGCSDDDAF